MDLVSGSKMKIKFYIVNYNNDHVLNNMILNSLSKSEYDRNNTQIFIINNHTNINVNDEYKSFVTILNNTLRIDESHGHLSRNWNQAILNGFRSLINPDCDIVIGCQNDSEVSLDWHKILLEKIEQYGFIQQGVGDQFQAWTPDAVKHIGLYDERFCNITHQEYDYFLRASLYYRDKSSINDVGHSCVFNSINERIIKDTGSGYNYRGDDEGRIKQKEIQDKCVSARGLTSNLFQTKWGIGSEALFNIINPDLEPLIGSYLYYPYFENDIITLDKQKFLR
jgi:hypothetical protein